MGFLAWLLGSAAAGALIGAGVGIWIAGVITDLKQDEANPRRRPYAWVGAVVGAIGICAWVMSQVLARV
jgi:hypothetical protein